VCRSAVAGILTGDDGEAQELARARDALATLHEPMMRRDPLAHPEQLIRAVYAYVAYRVGPGPDAEDITSDVFERALRYRESYDPKRGEPMAWLIGIARRCVNGAAADTHRALDSVEGRPAPGDVAEDTLRRLSLVDAVAKLSERDRELIALRYGADLTGRQIGAILDMSANAVDVAMHRAVERLRQALDGPEQSGNR
jgi:RNA polymerase sigma-70 factor (ECF subfamily)